MRFSGLRVLRGEFATLPAPERAMLMSRYRLPQPRTTLGPRLVGIAHAMLDVSDGLLADLGHICDVSQVGATVALAALPLSSAARRLVASDPDLALLLAGGGDDYELLFTAPPAAATAIDQLAGELNLPITAIGAIEPGAGVRLLDAEGHPIPVASAGYRHF